MFRVFRVFRFFSGSLGNVGSRVKEFVKVAIIELRDL